MMIDLESKTLTTLEAYLIEIFQDVKILWKEKPSDVYKKELEYLIREINKIREAQGVEESQLDSEKIIGKA